MPHTQPGTGEKLQKRFALPVLSYYRHCTSTVLRWRRRAACVAVRRSWARGFKKFAILQSSKLLLEASQKFQRHGTCLAQPRFPATAATAAGFHADSRKSAARRELAAKSQIRPPSNLPRRDRQPVDVATDKGHASATSGDKHTTNKRAQCAGVIRAWIVRVKRPVGCCGPHHRLLTLFRAVGPANAVSAVTKMDPTPHNFHE